MQNVKTAFVSVGKPDSGEAIFKTVKLWTDAGPCLILHGHVFITTVPMTLLSLRHNGSVAFHFDL